MKGKKITILSLLILLFSTGSAAYAKDAVREIHVNNNYYGSEFQTVVKNNTTLAPIALASHIPGIALSWNNATKTVTVKDSARSRTITLKEGDKFALVNQAKVALAEPVSIMKGRVMIPLRFVGEAAGAVVSWNPATKEVFIAKPDKTTLDKLASKSLPDNRDAAVNLAPWISLVENFVPTPIEMGSYALYFPAGDSKSYFHLYNDVISYYRIVNGIKYETWTARLGKPDKAGATPSTDKSLYFLDSSSQVIVKESGTRPQIKEKLTYLYIMPMGGLARYGFVGTDGKLTDLGLHEMNNNHAFFDIQEESQDE